MILANPKALFWAILAVPVIALYLCRARRRRHEVSAGYLWERVFAGRPAQSARWWRHPISLCLQLAILLLVVFAMAEPLLDSPQRLVLVIDNSASMNATDVEPTRLGHAKQLARRQLAALGYRDQMAIIAAGDPLRVHCGLTGRQDLLEKAIQNVTATDGPTRVADAVALGRRLPAGGPNGRIIVLSDGCFDGAAKLARQDDLRLIPIGGSGDNVGVTRLKARRSPADPRQCQILAEVTSFSDQPVQCRLQIELDAESIDAVPIELAPNGRWQQTFEMTAVEGGGRLSASLDRPDAFGADDRASVVVPPCPTRPVTLVTQGNLYLEKVLGACPLAELTVTATPPQKAAQRTILVLHRRTPTRLPEGPVLVLDPAGPCELWDLGDPLERPTIARQNDRLALLADVRLEGVRLSRARPPVLTDAARSTAKPVAWTADHVAVGYAIDRPGGRVVVLSGILEAGDLPLRTAFPILMTNVLQWLAAPERTLAGPPEDGRPAAAWRTRESDVRVPAELASPAEIAVAGSAGPPLWLFPTAFALMLLVAEWCLFQRRWIC